MTMMTTATMHWLWVAPADRLVDPTGREAAAVAPGGQVRGRHWWPCDRSTRAGDRALLCAMAPDVAVAYRVEVLSDAREPRPWEAVAGARPGLSVCDYVVRERVAAPVDDAEFARWRGLPQVRRGGPFPLSEAAWTALCEPRP